MMYGLSCRNSDWDSDIRNLWTILCKFRYHIYARTRASISAYSRREDSFTRYLITWLTVARYQHQRQSTWWEDPNAQETKGLEKDRDCKKNTHSDELVVRFRYRIQGRIWGGSETSSVDEYYLWRFRNKIYGRVCKPTLDTFMNYTNELFNSSFHVLIKKFQTCDQWIWLPPL